MGGEFKTFYLTMGDYDVVGIYEAPDDAVAARFILQLGAMGNIRTRTMKAFPRLRTGRSSTRSASWASQQ